MSSTLGTPPWLRPLCLGSFASLLVLQSLLAYFAITQDGAAPYLVLGVKILPLLAFAPMLWRNQKRAYIWLGFLLCLYFMQPVVDVFAGKHVLLNGLLIANLIELFVASLLFIRRYTEE